MEVYEKILSGNPAMPTYFTRNLSDLIKKLLRSQQGTQKILINYIYKLYINYIPMDTSIYSIYLFSYIYIIYIYCFYFICISYKILSI